MRFVLSTERWRAQSATAKQSNSVSCATVNEDQDINAVERYWQVHYGAGNGLI